MLKIAPATQVALNSHIIIHKHDQTYNSILGTQSCVLHYPRTPKPTRPAGKKVDIYSYKIYSEKGYSNSAPWGGIATNYGERQIASLGVLIWHLFF